MTDFVLDESVYVRALMADETDAEADHLAAALLMHCLQLAHRWVLTTEIMVAYYRQFARRVTSRGAVAHEVMASLKSILADANRYVIVDQPSAVPGLYDHDDDHIVAAAASGSSATVLITMDRRLRVALVNAGIPDTYSFRILDVGEARHELCTDDLTRRRASALP